MIKFFKSRLMRSIIPYFLLGVMLIIAFQVISDIGFFTGHMSRFWTVIMPFLVGGVLAYILNFPCSALQRLILKINVPFVQRKSRGLAVLALIIIIIILLTVIFNMFVPAAVDSISGFIEDFDSHAQTFLYWTAQLDELDLPGFFPSIDEEDILNMVNEFLQELPLDNVATGVVAGIGVAFGAVFTTILVTVSIIYLLIEKDRFRDFMVRAIAAIFPEKTGETILKYAGKLNHNFHMYVYAQTIDGIIVGLLMTGLLLIFGSEYAILLGVMLGVVNYIPYFGSIFGTAFAVLVVAFTQGIPTAAFAAIFMFIIQQADANYIQPRLMGGSFSLKPLLVIISVTVGMHYGGLLGMLVAIPIVAILKDLLDEYIAHCEVKRKEAPVQTESIMDKDIW